jgi:putative peptidoglycan lipid II flippase
MEEHGEKETWRLVWALATTLTLVLLGCLFLGEGLLVVLLRTAELTPKWQLALMLTAILLPYMLFICLTAFASAVLHTLNHFVAPAIAPVVLNICWIISVLLIAPLVTDGMEARIFIVATGISAAGVFQLGLQMWALHRKGFPLLHEPLLRHPAVRKIAIAMAPVAAGMAAFQINVLVDGIIAITFAAPDVESTLNVLGLQVNYPMQTGANSAIYYAERVMQFPLGVFGISLATAIFPALSRKAARKNWGEFKETLMDGLGATLFITIPAGAGLIVLRKPIVSLLFEHGEFSSGMTVRTGLVLAAYSTAIWAYCVLHLLQRAFYSTQDTLTPVKIAAASVVINIFLNLMLIWVFAEAGLALATAISATLQCAVLYWCVIHKFGKLKQSRLLKTLAKTAVATLLMGTLCYLCLHLLPTPTGQNTTPIKLIRVFVPVTIGLSAFLVTSKTLSVPELDIFVNMLRSRFSTKYRSRGE